MKSSALFRLHFIVFLWGFTAILGKLITVDAGVLVFHRMFFTALFLFIYIRFVRKQSIAISKKLFFQLAGVGSLMAFHWLFFFHSIKVSNVSIALSCISLSTLFVALLEPLVFRRKIDPSEVVMGVVILVCMYLIFKTEFQYQEGIIYGILAAVVGSLFSVFNGKLYGKTSSGNIIFYEIFCGWAVFSIFYALTGELALLGEISYTNLALVLLLASVFTAYPMFESISLMKYITPFTLVLTVNLEPVYGIVMAYFIFGESEHMSSVFYIASLVMILSIVANGIIKTRKKQQETTKNLQ
ncbi:DMT family transporter [Bergeyella porcorum]|uniref:DMT family transporter n=1 Tax=Bergeyella porcorum TaxID=1735111 RepID=UPI0035EDC639